MKITWLRTILLALVSTVFIFVACTGSPITTGIPAPPSPQELADQGFLLPELPRVTGEQLKQWMDNKEPLVVVDTRINFMFNQGHLPESINLPVTSGAEEMTAGLMALPQDRKIIFYCD